MLRHFALLLALLPSLACADEALLPAGASLVHPPVTVNLGTHGPAQVMLYTTGFGRSYDGTVRHIRQGRTTRLPPGERLGNYELAVKAVLTAEICETGKRALVVIEQTRQHGGNDADDGYGVIYTFDRDIWTRHLYWPDPGAGPDDDHSGGLLIEGGNAAAARKALRDPKLCTALISG